MRVLLLRGGRRPITEGWQLILGSIFETVERLVRFHKITLAQSRSVETR